MEASLEGIDSIGFSLLDFEFTADFTASKHYVEKLIKSALQKKFKGCNLLNVNIPKGNLNQIKGMKVCRQGRGHWIEEFKEAYDPRGRKYYWLTGRFENKDEGSDTDIWALNNNYVSIVPTGHDLTAYDALENLSYLENC